jgi:hypothetical protein
MITEEKAVGLFAAWLARTLVKKVQESKEKETPGVPVSF